MLEPEETIFHKLKDVSLRLMFKSRLVKIFVNHTQRVSSSRKNSFFHRLRELNDLRANSWANASESMQSLSKHQSDVRSLESAIEDAP